MLKDEREQVQASYFTMLLYVDSVDYDTSSVLAAVVDNFDEWAYALHDQDKKEDGTLKKPHYHVVFRDITESGDGSPKTVGYVASLLGIESQWVQPGIHSLDSDGKPITGRFNGCVKYLIHDTKSARKKNKHLYDRSIIVTNLNLDKYFGETFDMAKKIIEYILTNKPKTYTALCKWVIDNGCWAEFRRSQYAFRTIMDEVKSHAV